MKISTHHGNGLLLWHLFGGFGTVVIMLSPIWAFQIATGKSSEVTIIGPLTFARSWKCARKEQVVTGTQISIAEEMEAETF